MIQQIYRHFAIQNKKPEMPVRIDTQATENEPIHLWHIKITREVHSQFDLEKQSYDLMEFEPA